jgi:hypothetical protein
VFQKAVSTRDVCLVMAVENSADGLFFCCVSFIVIVRFEMLRVIFVKIQSGLLGCDAVYSGNYLPKFVKRFPPTSSGYKEYK